MIPKKKNKQRASDNTIDDVRRDLERMQNKKEKTGGSDSEIRLDVGDNYVRILPRGRKTKKNSWSRVFYLKIRVHYGVGPEAVKMRCPGENCYLCRRFRIERVKLNKKYERGSEEGKKAFYRLTDSLGYKDRWCMVAYQIVEGKTVKKSKLLDVGETIAAELLETWVGSDKEPGVDFTDPETGRPVNIRKRKTGEDKRAVEYKVKMSGGSKPIANWDTLQSKVSDLDALVEAKYPSKTPEEQKAILEGDGDEDYEDAEDDDDEDEKPAKKGKSSKKKSKSSRDEDDDDDDDDDDEDEDEEDEDEDEDEDDHPVKKKLKEVRPLV